jgi:hemin uptake protein HemP
MNAERDAREEDEAMQLHPEVDSVAQTPHELRTVRARDLLGKDRLLRIEHDGQLYTLRITRNERLILTK